MEFLWFCNQVLLKKTIDECKKCPWFHGINGNHHEFLKQKNTETYNCGFTSWGVYYLPSPLFELNLQKESFRDKQKEVKCPKINSNIIEVVPLKRRKKHGAMEWSTYRSDVQDRWRRANRLR